MGSRGFWLRAVLTVAAVALLAPVAPVVLSGFLPYAPVLANLSRLVVPWLPWLLLFSTLAGVAALLSVRLGGRFVQELVAVLAVLTVAGAVVMAGRVVAIGVAGGPSVNWARAAGMGGTSMPTADDELIYATVDGQPLHAQVWRPPDVASAVALFVHGGSFTGGGLGGRPWLFRSWAEQGVLVVDVEYRLSPPPLWDQAPGDVLCALGWVETHAQELDGGRLTDFTMTVAVVGDSAGGNLAMLAGYGVGTDKVTSSCAAPAAPPAAVIAIEPAADLAGIWQDKSVPGDGSPFPESYIGGSPSQYPDRYVAASPIRLIRAGVPPTLILGAENDHLILPARTADLEHRLVAAGAECRTFVVPYAEHGVAAGPDDYGEQLQEAAIPQYLAAITARHLTSMARAFGEACT